jgi:plastocyanin
MKICAMVAIATLGVWLASSASIQADVSKNLSEFASRTSTQHAELSGPGLDRHPRLAPQYADLMRYGLDRHPPLAPQYADLMRYGLDRHPPLAPQYAELSGQEPIQMVLQFGTETKNFVLTPKTLRFEKGKLYKLVIVNPSKTAHFVYAPEFGAAIDSISLTQRVALNQGDHQVWYFVTDQAGTYDIRCGIVGHAEAGMVGKIIVG